MIVRCPNPGCASDLAGEESFSGGTVECSHCGQRFVWPEMRRDFVIYDLETTGLSPDEEDLIQIAAIRFQDGKPVTGESFFSYAKPRRAISSFITSYTGITNGDVRGAPSPCEVLVEFSRFVGGSTLISHNGLRFDSKFLAATCVRGGVARREVPSIDSIWLSKAVFGNQRGTRHGLDIVIERLGIRPDVRRHDARGDVELLGLAVSHLWRHLNLPHDAAGVRRHETHLPKP